MARPETKKNNYSLNIDGKNIFVWLLQSSLVVALITAILYAFGSNFDYRLRWELGMQNIQFVRPTSDITYDGLIIVSAWFKTFQPYALGALGVILGFVLYSNRFKRVPVSYARTAKIVVVILVLASSGLIINRFLRVRSASIANVLRQKANAGQDTLVTVDGKTYDGNVVSSSDSRTAFLTKVGTVLVLDKKDIASISLTARQQ